MVKPYRRDCNRYCGVFTNIVQTISAIQTKEQFLVNRFTLTKSSKKALQVKLQVIL